MKMINSIIIDDEDQNRNVLEMLINKHCPQINVISEAANADDAFTLINKLKPQLVFLDIRMPNKSGFDLLKMFPRIDFEVIFISAFSEFAITAFDFNAIAYILKPIDYSKLIFATNKAIHKIQANIKDENFENFINSIDGKKTLVQKIAVHNKDTVVLVNISDIVSIESNEDIRVIKTKDNEVFSSIKELKLFEDLFREHLFLVRISRQVIINTNYIKSYSKGEVCVILLNNGFTFEVSRRKKAEILSKILVVC